jgi:hypothetical protein
LNNQGKPEGNNNIEHRNTKCSMVDSMLERDSQGTETIVN